MRWKTLISDKNKYTIFLIYLDLNPSLLDVPGLEEDFVLNADLLLIGRDPGCSSITPSSSMVYDLT